MARWPAIWRLLRGPHSVVLAGGLDPAHEIRIAGESGFHDRFTAKGRFQGPDGDERSRAELAVHAEIGLYGAAAAFRDTRKT